jgi:hypothetical protein
MFHLFYMYVTSVSLDVAKVDLDVAYICKCFRGFHIYVASVSSKCLYMFALATHMFSSFFDVFTSVSDVCYKCFSCFGRNILQVFHLNVAKVDLVLHMLQREPPAAAACCSCWGATKGHRVSV